MSAEAFYPYLLVMAGVTYLIRMLPLTVFRREIRSPFLRSFLYYVPYAVLGAMTVPDIFYATGSLWTALAGLVVAVVLAWKEKSLLTVAVFACAAVAVTTVQGNLALWPQTQADPIIAEVGQFIQAHTQPDEGVAIGVNNPSYLNAANRRGYRANIAYYDYIPTGPEAEVTYFIEHGVRWFVVVQGWVYNDEDGAYRTYLREQFPVAATGTNCVIYDLQGE